MYNSATTQTPQQSESQTATGSWSTAINSYIYIGEYVDELHILTSLRSLGPNNV